jgi:mono/diheme cytochrome c family protein
MRILFGISAAMGLAFSLPGCGAPEAEFSYSTDTQELLPAAQKTVKNYVEERFGKPAKMVAWQRLPIDFGGVPGVIRDVVRLEDNEHIITGFTVDFRVPALIADYDSNLDGMLSFSELPIELQQAITPEGFEGADGDEDGLLNPTELADLPEVESELFRTGTVSQVSGENAQELIGKELLFVDGRYAGQHTEVTGIDLENRLVEIRPPLSDQVDEGAAAVDLTNNQIMVDFGRTMREGRHLYMRHCMHCHGVTGDGNGPTAKYLSPLPRDYRQGVFKFISTRAETVRRPSLEDLDRIVRNGIPGTYMPSFSMLKDQEVHDIIEYVRWLSMRGEYEAQLNVLLMEYTNKAVADKIQRQVETYEQDLESGLVSKDDPPVTRDSVRREVDQNLADLLETELPESSDRNATIIADTWRAADLHANLIYPTVAKPPASEASIARGRQFYLSKCAVCHGVTAEGDGENTRGYQKDPQGNEYPAPGFFDVWGHPIQPRNLNAGIYRGGRRPLDLYRRIHQGIPGTPMQAFGTAFTDEQIWDLVDYVMSIPINGPIPDQNVQIAKARPGQTTRVARSEKDSGDDSQ